MSTNVPSEIRIPAGESGRRLDRFLRRRFPLASLPDIYSQIRTGRVRLNGKKCRPAHRVHEGDLLTLPGSLVSEGGRRSPPLASRVDIRLKYEDSDLIVVDKPPGLVVHPGSRHSSNTLVGQAGLLLRRAGEEPDIHLVHRLDRNTSGLLVLARSPRIARALSELFRAGDISKEYTALVAGQPPGEAPSVSRSPRNRCPPDDESRPDPEASPPRPRTFALPRRRDSLFSA